MGTISFPSGLPHWGWTRTLPWLATAYRQPLWGDWGHLCGCPLLKGKIVACSVIYLLSSNVCSYPGRKIAFRELWYPPKASGSCGKALGTPFPAGPERVGMQMKQQWARQSKGRGVFFLCIQRGRGHSQLSQQRHQPSNIQRRNPSWALLDLVKLYLRL